MPSVTFDTRDNLFTPTRGTYIEGRLGIASDVLGSDDSFERLRVIGMHFLPPYRGLFLGVRGEAGGIYGEAPFYVRPYVNQRGVPVMRYQGDQMAQIEAELRWQFWKRFSAIGFAGTGGTWTDVSGRTWSRSVTAGGGGFRYELARAYGIHIGADFAYGPDGSAFYVQFGSAWARP
jgi:outer membrane translocation and assembly module TamA